MEMGFVNSQQNKWKKSGKTFRKESLGRTSHQEIARTCSKGLGSHLTLASTSVGGVCKISPVQTVRLLHPGATTSHNKENAREIQLLTRTRQSTDRQWHWQDRLSKGLGLEDDFSVSDGQGKLIHSALKGRLIPDRKIRQVRYSPLYTLSRSIAIFLSLTSRYLC